MFDNWKRRRGLWSAGTTTPEFRAPRACHQAGLRSRWRKLHHGHVAGGTAVASSTIARAAQHSGGPASPTSGLVAHLRNSSIASHASRLATMSS
jgi:hypothetical protein